MPTFVFLLDGKKLHEFSGAGEQQLKQFTEQIVNKSQRQNVRVTEANLIAFYGEYDKEKEEEAIKSIHAKCANAVKKNSDDCRGGAAADLHKKLKKKYGKGPKMEKAFKPVEKDEKESEEKSAPAPAPEKQQRRKASSSSNAPPPSSLKPNLHLASTEEILAELEKREEEERERREEEEEVSERTSVARENEK